MMLLYGHAFRVVSKERHKCTEVPSAVGRSDTGSDSVGLELGVRTYRVGTLATRPISVSTKVALPRLVPPPTELGRTPP